MAKMSASDRAAIEDAIRTLLHRLPEGTTLTATRPGGEHAQVRYDDGERVTLYLPEHAKRRDR